MRDLIEAQTLTQARHGRQPDGRRAQSRAWQPVKQELVELIALLEAGIDFAEDDVEVTPQARKLSLASIQFPRELQIAGAFL